MHFFISIGKKNEAYTFSSKIGQERRTLMGLDASAWSRYRIHHQTDYCDWETVMVTYWM